MCFSQEGSCSSVDELCWGTPVHAAEPGAWHGRVQMVGSAGCSQGSVLQPALMGSSKAKLDKDKYSHINYLPRAELAVFCTDSGVSGEG